MATINLELWEHPNFPPLGILESRTKTVLEAFNKCRRLDIKLQTNNRKINEFYPLFNSLTERRAVESLRLSMYAEDVGIYMKLLSEENTSVGVILETLSSLLDSAQDRQEDTKNLKKDYQEFIERFDVEFSNIQTRFTSDSRQIVIRNQNKDPIRKILFIEIVNYSLPFFVSLGAFKFFDYFFSKISNPVLVGFLTFGISGAYLKYYGNKNELMIKDNDGLAGDSTNHESINNDYIEDSESVNEYHPRVKNPFDDSLMNDDDSLMNDNDSGFFENKVEDNIKPNPTSVISENESTSLPANSDQTISGNEQSSLPDQIIQISENELPSSFPGNGQSSLPDQVNQDVSSPSYDLLAPHYLTAGIFSIFVYYLMYKFLRKTKPTQYQLWMKYFMSKINNPKPRSSRQVLDDQQNFEKENKILEIKEKLPVIFQSVEILDQFWINQIINIKSHIETLKSVDENEKIIIPQQIATPIKEDWDKQSTESRANHSRMKDLVTRNSLLSID